MCTMATEKEISTSQMPPPVAYSSLAYVTNATLAVADHPKGPTKN